MPIGEDTHVYRHKLPHLQRLGKTYFITFATRGRRVLPETARDTVLACCIHDHSLTYWLHCVVVMPDHVHLICTPYERFTIPRIMSRIKSVSAHLVDDGALWKRDYFDRILRSDEDVRKKGEYLLQNPVRAGLVTSFDDYRWSWRSW